MIAIELRQFNSNFASIIHIYPQLPVDKIVEISTVGIAKLLPANTYRVLHKRAAH